MIDTPTSAGLAGLLDARGDQMAVCAEVPWLAHFSDMPENASRPLAMSGPHPRAVGSYGADYIKWTRDEFGVTLRWWQQLASTRQLEHDEDGTLVWREVIESGPRRIGKSVRLRTCATWRTAMGASFFGEPQLSMLVSKDLAVGKEIHRGSWRWADKKSWTVIRLGGAQEIESPEGDRWLLRAPNAAYGYDVCYGQVDESWGVDPMAITDGLEPALLERISPQLHLTSTAHVRASSLMRRRLTVALRDADPSVLLLMWGARPDADWSDEATWRSASPHWSEDRRELMARKYAAALAGQDEPEFDDPDPVRGWAAQYLNVWPLLIGGEATSTLFPNWSKLSTSNKPPPPAALGIASDLDQTWLSLGSASSGDRPHLGSVLRVRVAESESFIGEVARICDKYRICVAIDQKGPAAFLVGRLSERLGSSLVLGGLDDLVQASADLHQSVETSGVEHGDYTELNAAIDAATWRFVGDRRVFGRKSGDISSLEAATWALWCVEQGGNVLNNVW